MKYFRIREERIKNEGLIESIDERKREKNYKVL